MRKIDIIRELLTCSSGVTTPETLAALGWPTISMQAQAKALGLMLVVDRSQRPFRYFGKTPADAAQAEAVAEIRASLARIAAQLDLIEARP
jgi:hypothetical protein